MLPAASLYNLSLIRWKKKTKQNKKQPNLCLRQKFYTLRYHSRKRHQKRVSINNRVWGGVYDRNFPLDSSQSHIYLSSFSSEEVQPCYHWSRQNQQCCWWSGKTSSLAEGETELNNIAQLFLWMLRKWSGPKQWEPWLLLSWETWLNSLPINALFAKWFRNWIKLPSPLKLGKIELK